VDSKNKVEVIIDGLPYKLVGVESEEYIQKIANYIDRKFKDISSTQGGSALDKKTLAVLVSVNVTDALFKTYEEKQSQAKELEAVKKE